jgi:hypothetical protein
MTCSLCVGTPGQNETQKVYPDIPLAPEDVWFCSAVLANVGAMRQLRWTSCGRVLQAYGRNQVETFNVVGWVVSNIKPQNTTINIVKTYCVNFVSDINHIYEVILTSCSSYELSEDPFPMVELEFHHILR